ncbi:DUF6443 domain-containing protein [Roseivirga thermotolerans]|uniref:DUF6443 domain-containing protein n=1 Tax=Roseivirga thermotolerans TaxID=1758176 RepID=UPI00273D9884|nr:DUF6443 domain-containing protein [Roseivirga thermotolerans]
MTHTKIRYATGVLALIFVIPGVFGQVKPNGSTQGIKTSTLPSTSYTGTEKVNYVRTFDFYKAMMAETNLSTEIDNSNVMQTTQYVDGLGRPIQTVARKALPGGNDMVQYVVYDEYGRREYQPMAFQSEYTDGRMHLSPSARLDAFMNGDGQLTSGFYPYEDIFYGKTEFEASPLNRVKKQMAPGNSWAGSGVGVSNDWRSNHSGDGVRRWTISGSSASSPGVYANNELMVTITTDEEQHQVREFTDKLGRVVLKRVQKAGSTADARTNWHSTYYVYDDFGNLRFVLPPRAEEVLSAANWVWNTTDMDALAFHYTYDGRNRMITKRVPGGGLVEMVYDQLDRLVLTRDANHSSQGKWQFTKYDAHSRPVMTGFINSSNTRATMQSQADASAVLNVSTDPLTTANVLEAHSISLSHHVSGTVTYRATTSIEFLPGFDSNGQYFDTEIVPALSTDYTFVQGYHDATFPSLKTYTEEIHTVSYYDNYAFTTQNYDNSQEVDFYTAGDKNSLNPEAYTNAKGLATGSRVKVLNSENHWLTTVMFYDNRGRVIQTKADNHLGGTDIQTTQYDFSGKVLNTYSVHTNPQASGNDSQTTLSKRFEYESSGTGRLVSIKQKINGGSEKTLVTHTYDHMGQLKEKKLGSAASPLETLHYTYNVRGWLKGINQDYVNTGTGNHFFGMDLSYDHGFTQSQLNGNIAGVKWRSKSSGQVRAYGFDYDQSNRLLKADYTQGSTWLQTTSDFSTTYSYDVNGNIQTLTRKGVVAGSIQTIDNLTYTYLNSGKSNQLASVTDAVGDLGQGDFVDGNTSGNDYAYDGNGNMITDLNKDIQSGDITYNHLNLPQTITFGNSSTKTITYTYDASGIKLSKKVNNGGDITTTDYLGSYIYENNQLQHFAHEEGRVRKSNQGNLVYDYYVKDHLGNTRMTLTEEEEQTIYLATMESDVTPSGTNLGQYEESLFLNIAATRDNLLPSANHTVEPGINNDETARLNGAESSRRVGPAKLLAVSPGDQLSIEAYAYHQGGYSDNQSITQAELVTAVASAFGGVNNGTTEQQSIYNLFNGQGSTLLVGSNGSSASPRAYLNYILFDQDFGYIDAGFVQVGSTANVHHQLTLNKSIAQGGYIYIYLSNESNTNHNVYFDDFRITHTKGQILQEDHYYPFGLGIAALSSTAPLSKPNNYLYNGKELQNETGWYDYGARHYDPQLGRFFTQDRFAEKYFDFSPYQYAANNPILYIDVNGDSISVAEQYRDQFQADLQATFGDKASNFTFNESGKVVFTGNKKDFKGKERKALKGLQKVLNEETTTNVIYEDQIEIAGQTIPAEGEGGALSILASENPDLLTENIVLISPNNTPTEINYIEFSEGFPQKTLDNNRATSLFHELGHIIHAGQDQAKVIQFDNTVRSIQKAPNPDGTFRKSPLKKRTPDITHNRASGGVIIGGN